MGFAAMYDQKISAMSGGEKTRLKLCRLLLEQPDILFLDEPTNHLDVATLFWLENYLKSYRGAIFTVSHDRYFLDATVGKIFELENCRVRAFRGNYSKYKVLKAEQYEHDLREYEKQQEEIAALEDYVARNIVRATTAKSAQSRVKKLESMERLEKPTPPPAAARVRLYRGGKERGAHAVGGKPVPARGGKAAAFLRVLRGAPRRKDRRGRRERSGQIDAHPRDRARNGPRHPPRAVYARRLLRPGERRPRPGGDGARRAVAPATRRWARRRRARCSRARSWARRTWKSGFASLSGGRAGEAGAGAARGAERQRAHPRRADQPPRPAGAREPRGGAAPL